MNDVRCVRNPSDWDGIDYLFCLRTRHIVYNCTVFVRALLCTFPLRNSKAENGWCDADSNIITREQDYTTAYATSRELLVFKTAVPENRASSTLSRRTE